TPTGTKVPSTDTPTTTATVTPSRTSSPTATTPAGATSTPTPTLAAEVINFTLPTGPPVTLTVVSNNSQVSLSFPSDFLGTAGEGQNVQISLAPSTVAAGQELNSATPNLVVEIDLSGA